MPVSAQLRRIPTAFVILILVIFPLIYQLNALTPWLNNYTERRYWWLGWGSIFILHWICTALILRLFSKRNISLREIGLYTRPTITIIVLYFGIAAWLVISGSENKYASYNFILPHTANERLIWILFAFTAGFCEEIVFRGFAIRVLHAKGINQWIGLLLTPVSFALIHAGVLHNAIYGYFLVVFAIIMGLLLIWSKRLWPGMFIHMTYNLCIGFGCFSS